MTKRCIEGTIQRLYSLAVLIQITISTRSLKDFSYFIINITEGKSNSACNPSTCTIKIHCQLAGCSFYTHEPGKFNLSFQFLCKAYLTREHLGSFWSQSSQASFFLFFFGISLKWVCFQFNFSVVPPICLFQLAFCCSFQVSQLTMCHKSIPHNLGKIMSQPSREQTESKRLKGVFFFSIGLSFMKPVDNVIECGPWEVVLFSSYTIKRLNRVKAMPECDWTTTYLKAVFARLCI